MTLVQLSPTKYCHCLIITSWKLQKTRNAAPVHLRVIIYFVNISQPHWKKKKYFVGSSQLLEWLNPSLPSSQTTDSCYISFILKGEWASHLPLHPHSLLQALRQPTEQRDRKWSRETRQLSTRLEPKPTHSHTHTHLHWCTKTTRKPHLFSNLSLPEMLFCVAHNCLFHTFPTCWGLVHTKV